VLPSPLPPARDIARWVTAFHVSCVLALLAAGCIGIWHFFCVTR
jgi:hypothetical protein